MSASKSPFYANVGARKAALVGAIFPGVITFTSTLPAPHSFYLADKKRGHVPYFTSAG